MKHPVCYRVIKRSPIESGFHEWCVSLDGIEDPKADIVIVSEGLLYHEDNRYGIISFHETSNGFFWTGFTILTHKPSDEVLQTD